MIAIKDAIKQRKFKSSHQEAMINFLYTYSWYDRKLKLALKPFGVSPQQYNVLRILRGAQPEAVSVAYILERMIDKESNITRLVDKLIDKKFVTREICRENRRKMDIAITVKGLNELLLMDPVVEETASCFNNISKKEAEILSELLDKVRN